MSTGPTDFKDISKLPGENPNPVIRAGVARNILYKNKAAATVLEDWEIKTGNTLPGIFHGPIKTALNLEKKSGNGGGA